MGRSPFSVIPAQAGIQQIHIVMKAAITGNSGKSPFIDTLEGRNPVASNGCGIHIFPKADQKLFIDTLLRGNDDCWIPAILIASIAAYRMCDRLASGPFRMPDHVPVLNIYTARVRRPPPAHPAL